MNEASCSALLTRTLHTYYVSLPDWSPVAQRLGGSQVAWVSLMLKHYYSFLVVLNEPFQSGDFLQFLKWVQRSVQSEFVYIPRPTKYILMS